MRGWAALLIASISGCAAPRSPAAPHAELEGSLEEFERSPGGVAEVSVDWVHAHRGEARLIDVREEHELTRDGHISDIEWVPLGELAAAAAGWDRSERVVLVCRSGRRSARAVEELEALGFRDAASMTGGMIAWSTRALETSHARDFADARPVLGAEPGDDPRVRWVRVAALLLGGSEACIDGRDAHAVVGTPGGDVGELVLMLATAEALAGRPMSAGEVERLVSEYADAFGRIYLHTDVHAIERIGRALGPSLDASSDVRADVRGVEALLRHPPRAREDEVVAIATAPENVGCGHLRSMLQSPADYGVRGELVRDTLRAVHRALIRRPSTVDFVVLGGEHHESEVLFVELAAGVHAYSSVPALAPSSGEASAFVVHPQVTAFLREQNAFFLLEHAPWLLGDGVSAELFVERQRALADRQLESTLSRLGAGLPRRTLVFARSPGAAQGSAAQGVAGSPASSATSSPPSSQP